MPPHDLLTPPSLIQFRRNKEFLFEKAGFPTDERWSSASRKWWVDGLNDPNKDLKGWRFHLSRKLKIDWFRFGSTLPGLSDLEHGRIEVAPRGLLVYRLHRLWVLPAPECGRDFRRYVGELGREESSVGVPAAASKGAKRSFRQVLAASSWSRYSPPPWSPCTSRIRGPSAPSIKASRCSSSAALV